MNAFPKSILVFFFLASALSPLNAQSYGFFQIVQNSADPSLDTIDLYFNGGNLNSAGAFEDSNVVYHAATGFIAYPTDTAFTISINYKHSNGNLANGVIYSHTFPAGTLVANQRIEFIISGVNGSGFAPNPDNLNTGIGINIISNIDSLAFFYNTQVYDTGLVTLRFFNGVTDLPGIKIIYRNGSSLISSDSLVYGSAGADTSIHHQAYEFQVVSGDGTRNFGTFSANLTNFGGQSIVILLSGLVNIDSTDSSSAFGMYGLLNTGSVINFPLETAGFQLLNNSPDPNIDSLDVYVNGLLAFHNVGFRNATPELIFKAYATYNIGVAPKNSLSVADTFWNETFTFPRDTFFIATALGLQSQTGFAPNPDGLSTAFKILIKSPAEFTASSLTNFDFFMINGVTDAPGLNLQPEGGPTLLSNVEYSEQTNYVSLPSEFYVLYLQDTSGNTLVNGFANFLAFNAQSAVLLASGFLNPANNNNGPAMGLFMVPTNGGPFIPLYSVTGIDPVSANNELSLFPNPTNNQLHVLIKVTQPELVTFQIVDLNGQLVKSVLNNEPLSDSYNCDVDLSSLSQGLYISRLTTSTGTINTRFAIVR